MKSNNLKSENPIGIFDSGIGGLTVASAIKHYLPNEQLIYFGDTAHLPYGDKAPYSIKHYSTEITKLLLASKCKAIVIACHTASSVAYKEIEKTVDAQALLINVIDPVIKEVVGKFKGNKIGVIGTKGTISSGMYKKKLKEASPNLKISSMATPLLAPMIEEGFVNDKISQTVVDSYLSDKRLEGIESIILACTHYPLIKRQIDAFYGGNVEVVDTADIVARNIKQLLEEKKLLNDKKRASHHFYVSDFTKNFEQSTRYFFKEKIHLEKKAIWS